MFNPESPVLFLTVSQALDFGLAPCGIYLVWDNMTDEKAGQDMPDENAWQGHALDVARLTGHNGDGLILFPLYRD